MSIEEEIRQLRMRIDYLTQLVEVLAAKQHMYEPPKVLELKNREWMKDGTASAKL